MDSDLSNQKSSFENQRQNLLSDYSMNRGRLQQLHSNLTQYDSELSRPEFKEIESKVLDFYIQHTLSKDLSSSLQV